MKQIVSYWSFFCLLSVLPLQAAIVTTLSDQNETPAGSEVSLREAIRDAGPNETITFAAGLDGGTITLSSGVLVIDQSITIDASAFDNGITIDAVATPAMPSRVLQIRPGHSVAIDSVQITGGYTFESGGGIYNEGTLTLSNSTLSNNSAIGSVVGGGGEGGAIYNSNGTLTLNNSTLSGNSATGNGGGIFNSGTAILKNTTLTGNSADDGGGIYNGNSLTLNNTTLSGNSAETTAGGVYNIAGGSFALDNSLVALNTASHSIDVFGIYTYSGSNIVMSGGTGVPVVEAGTHTLSTANPMLAPLGNYGGPTQTMPPVPGSPAIDPIDSPTTSIFTQDQRGAPRVSNGVLDIGAVEFVPAIVTTNDDNSDPNDGLNLREAIATPFATAVTFDPNIFLGIDDLNTITLINDELVIDQSLSIDASMINGGITIDADGSVTSRRRGIAVNSGKSVRIDSVHITGGNAFGNGGGILNSGILELSNATISGNVTITDGGGIYNGYAGGDPYAPLALILNNVSVSGNIADGDGGGISTYFGTVTATNTTISGNQSGSNGGGINIIGSPMTLNKSTISGNEAATSGGAGAGGAIYHDGSLILNNSTLSGNSAYQGGGIFSSSGSLTINQSTISNNSAIGTNFIGTGGGIKNSGGNITDITLINSIVARNTKAGAVNDDIVGDFTFQESNIILAGGTGIASAEAGTHIILSVDPLLAPLGDYGGFTQTMPPLLNSPAIDASSPTSPGGTDQRGAPRFADGDGNAPTLLDIGAVEVQIELLVTNADDSGSGSLRESIALAGSGANISFDPSLSGDQVTLDSRQIEINQSMTIDASSLPDGFSISSDGYSRILQVNAGNAVVIDSLSLRNGQDTNGGGIFNAGTLTLNHLTIEGNDALYNGGGIYNEGNLTLNNSTLSGNAANFGGFASIDDGDGGGIFNSGTLTLNNSTISGQNTSRSEHNADNGGAIFNEGTAYLNNSTLSENSASLSGGGIFNTAAASLNLEHTIVADNRLPVSGAGADIFNDSGILTIAGINLIREIAGSGLAEGANLIVGAPRLAPLANYGGSTLTMPPLPTSPAIDPTNLIITTIIPADQRGAARVVNGILDIGAVEFQSNIVTSNLDDGSSGTLRDALLDGPTNEYISAITFDPSLDGETISLTGGQLLLDKSIAIDASNLSDGLTIDAQDNSRIFQIEFGSAVVIDFLTLANGQSDNEAGGAIYNSGALILNNSTLSGNHTNNRGGAIFNDWSLVINQSTLSGNSANFGGAIFNEWATASLTNTTVASNEAATSGGGVYTDSSSTLVLENTIVASNSAQGFALGSDIFSNGGSITANGVNLIEAFPFPGLSASSNVIAATPLLHPLGDYGGPTQTMPPMLNSPAIDSALSTTQITDQRGRPRVNGGLPDIGAVEAQLVFVITNTDDAGSNSLREALDFADDSASITFDPSLAGGTITLTTGELTIDQSLTIDASALGNGLTIDANGGAATRAIKVNSGKSVLIDSLQITNGYANIGGGILNDGDLTLNSVTLSNNEADVLGGGIANSDTLTLNNCTLFNNSAFIEGGGIANTADLVVNNSTIANNSAEFGGGIHNSFYATLTLNNSILHGNSAVSEGGAIHNDHSTAITLNNTTLVDNSANFGAGIFNNITDLTLNNSTITGNFAHDTGGGIVNLGGTLSIDNSIVAVNEDANGLSDIDGAYTYSGRNVVMASDSGVASTAPGIHSQINQDPRLAPPGDYGGPTNTMPPLPGSPAIEPANGSTSSLLTTDQRGAARIAGQFVDIGAVEAFPFSTLTLEDSEGDGIPDIFEGLGGLYPHLSIETDDSTLDTDGDGSLDTDEIANMTDPLDANDSFRILSFVPAAGFDAATNPVFDITVKTFPGLDYELEANENLDFSGAPSKIEIIETANFTESMEVQLLPGKDFIRAVRK